MLTPDGDSSSSLVDRNSKDNKIVDPINSMWQTSTVPTVTSMQMIDVDALIPSTGQASSIPCASSISNYVTENPTPIAMLSSSKPLVQPKAKPTAKLSCNKKNDKNRDIKFRSYQCEKWYARFEELCQYQEQHGNCLVPHYYEINRPLARWVKRQRYQYSLFLKGKKSSITKERIALLSRCGFVWDSHDAVWHETVQELHEHRRRHGAMMIPSNFRGNPRLGNWVKNQRRQYKLYKAGKPTAISAERILDLEQLGFELEPKYANVDPRNGHQAANHQHHQVADNTTRKDHAKPHIQKSDQEEGKDDDEASQSSLSSSLYDTMLDVLSILSSSDAEDSLDFGFSEAKHRSATDEEEDFIIDYMSDLSDGGR